MTPKHILDRPIWSSLSGRLQHLSVGDDTARRFRSDISAFIAPADHDAEALAGMAALVDVGDEVIAIEPSPIPTPPGFERAMDRPLVQLHPSRAIDAPALVDVEAELMGDDDAEAMYDLATLTKPGPYRLRTYQMGRFVGIKQEGRLIAMGGERFVAPGMTEISAICVHPDFQGRGLGRYLSALGAKAIYDRGETPFIQAWSTNTPAIKLYESMGFKIRRELDVTALRRV